MLLKRDRFMLAAVILLDVAFYAGRTSTVSAADLADRAGLARRGIEPLLQMLARSGLLESVRGPRGGYRLGRPRREIRLDEVMRLALSDDTATEDGPHGALLDRVLGPLWSELDAEFAARLHRVTLDELVRRAEAAGFCRPSAEPISFSI